MSLRRACSRIAPRAIAAVTEVAASAECVAVAPLRRAACGAVRSQAAAQLREFRSSAVSCSSLVKTLLSEANYEKENYSQPEELAGGPPKAFKLEDTPGDTHLSLTRTYGDEEISVDLMVNNQPEQDTYETEEGELEVDVSVIFNASVTKGDKSLVFECRSDGSYLDIQHVSLEPAEGEVPESYYTGPVYAELDEQLQTDFKEYLNDRGINEDLGAYLLQLMHDKEQREYTRWLQNVHSFASK